MSICLLLSDVNECVANVDICTDKKTECINTLGSYECLCKEGFMEVNRKCVCKWLVIAELIVLSHNWVTIRSLMATFRPLYIYTAGLHQVMVSTGYVSVKVAPRLAMTGAFRFSRLLLLKSSNEQQPKKGSKCTNHRQPRCYLYWHIARRHHRLMKTSRTAVETLRFTIILWHNSKTND